MQLEQTLEMYRPTQIQINLPEQRQRTYTIRDLESLSSTALYTGELQNGASWARGPEINFSKNTAYFPLTFDKQMGITHHSSGLGKLKYTQDGIEYGVPISDIIDKPLEKWRIDRT